ncbi:MAG: hypothetical protein ACRDPK_14370, partial [Carbonactinosporaceae bacterium]
LGLGRALGEAVAVAMVLSAVAPGAAPRTIASAIVASFGGQPVNGEALLTLGLTLLAGTAVVTWAGRALIVRRAGPSNGPGSRHRTGPTA